MSYCKYRVLESDRLPTRSSTDGYQPKFLVDNGYNFIKSQCVIGRTLRDDWRVEHIASRICEQLGIYAVQQRPCTVVIKNLKGTTVERTGVISNNFERNGDRFVSFNRLLELKSINFDSEFTKSDAATKLDLLVATLCKCTGLFLSSIQRYVYSMVTVDMLVLNQDRHFSNFGVIDSPSSGGYVIAPLFDFGMGLFESDTVYDDLVSLQDCLRYSYIAPFGEDPFELLDMLKAVPSYCSFLRSLPLRELRIEKRLFVHPASYEFFKKMRRLML